MNKQAKTDFDVIIVGGRVAGGALAVHLGRAGLTVLLLERAKLPSKHPASSPIIGPKGMLLLDRLGADEVCYARGTPRLHRFVYDIRDAFSVVNPVMDLYGRNYGYAVDRLRFDETLWALASAEPTVTAWDETAVTDLLYEEERVCGVVVRRGRETTHLTAGVVVGADGRFSTIAQKVAAREYGRWRRFPTSLLYAYWEGVRPADDTGEPTIHFISPSHGLGVLMLESADGTTAVTIEGQTKRLHGAADGRLADHYHALLREIPLVQRRIAHGQPVTKISGIRDVGNGYRQAFGAGWVLVGDAVHQKDPVDGQGVYDALVTAAMLAEALGRWWGEGVPWEVALAEYEKAVYAEMHSMYKATLVTSYEYFYMPLPQWGFRTFGRWLFEDEDYLRQLRLLLGRGLENPARWRPLPLVLRAWGRGLWRDVWGRG